MNREIIQDGTGNYLKIWDAEGDSLGDSIFLHNHLSGFLPVEIQRINGRKEYLYDISGKISLEDHLSRDKFSLEEICILFQRLFMMSAEAGEYLLDQNGVVVHQEYLYLDKNMDGLAGIYQPGAEMCGIRAYSRLLEFIMEKMDQKDRELVFFVYNMHKLTKQPECTRELLRQYVEEAAASQTAPEEDASFLPTKNMRKKPAGSYAGLEKMPAGSRSVGRSMENGGRGNRSAGRSIGNSGRGSRSVGRSIGNSGRGSRSVGRNIENSSRSTGQSEGRENTFWECLPGKEYLGAAILVLFAIAGFFFLWFYGVFSTPLTGQTDWLKAGGAALFIFAVAGYGVWRLLCVGKKREAAVFYEDRRIIKRVCLIPQKGGEPVPISYFPCHVGTAEGKVDTRIDAEGISGVHAQFLQEGEDILVMDEESAGGTFANEQRLAPWQKKKIQDGDILRFAGKEYVVEITQSEYAM